MDKGDIVVCIRNTTYETKLTLNKHYKVVSNQRRLQSGFEMFDDYIEVVDDEGEVFNFISNRFILISEWREKKLDQIGI